MPRKRDPGVCRHCGGKLPENALFCPWCGDRQVTDKKEIKVPRPQRLPSGSWFARVTVAGQRVPVTAATEAEYYAAARAIKAGLLETKGKRPRLPLSAAIDRYIDSRRGSVSPSTVATYEKKKRLYFLALMDTDVHAITAEMLQDEIRRMLAARLSPKTVSDAYKFILTVLKYSGASPDTTRVRLPQIPASPFAILTDAEQARLLQEIVGDPCELPILLALWLGLRRSEILALEREDFDFVHKTVRISRAAVRDEKGRWVTKGTKTAKSARTIVCPDYILEKVEQLPPGRIYDHDANYILKCLHRCCERAGLPSVRLHDLRHINASVGLSLGLPDKYIMERGGWSAKETMVYRYEHTYADQKTATDRAMNTHFESLLPSADNKKNSGDS